MPLTEASRKPPRPTVHALLGTTGVGKTELALAVAERAGAEVLSMDSMLVYRGLDVGTAKPTAAERARVPHHLIDLVEPSEAYAVSHWLKAAEAAEADVLERGARALFVGGTAFYLKALLAGLFEGPPIDVALRERLEARALEVGSPGLHAELVGVDPRSAERIHPNDKKRVVRALEVFEQTGKPLSDWQTSWGFHGSESARGGERQRRLVGLTRPTEVLDARIRTRTEAMLDAGWAQEAAALRAAGGLSKSAAQALGYAEALAYADGELDRAECVDRIALATRQFARRQRTWLRRFPEIVWIDLETTEDPAERVGEVLGALDWSD